MSSDTTGTNTGFLSGPNGLHAASPACLAECRAASAGLKAVVVDIDIGEDADKDMVLARFAQGFDLPRWFGHNWDALADCLTDLEWLPDGALILMLEGSMSDPVDARTLIAILRDCCESWEAAGRPFHALVDQRLLDHG